MRYLYLIIVLFLVFPRTSYSAYIYKVKKNKVYIRLDKKGQFRKGNIVFAYKDEEKKAKVKLYKFRGKKALGKILTGIVKKKYVIRLEDQSGKNLLFFKNKKELGSVLFGVTQISQKFNQTSYSGLGYNLKYTKEVLLKKRISIHILLGYENFAINEDSLGNNYSFSNNYISFEVLPQWFYEKSKFEYYTGIGLGVKIPVTRDNSLGYNIESVSFLKFSAGLKYRFKFRSKFIFIPLELGYSYDIPTRALYTSSVSIITGIGGEF